MSRVEKLIKRLLDRPKDFKWRELVMLLKALGYEEAKRGKTGGSRRRFVHERTAPITLHEPHDGVLRRYQIDLVIENLERGGMI
ncbi:MAG: type II toxin-antitoxin system HicA family toxin [Candidatus Dadabacteria bacterium]|nr:type II toxin-antitoxin system HicA family toxin [Candidatus Dadabacteria bacterium]